MGELHSPAKCKITIAARIYLLTICCGKCVIILNKAQTKHKTVLVLYLRCELSAEI